MSNSVIFCACKGIRTCNACRQAKLITEHTAHLLASKEKFVYCEHCKHAWETTCVDSHSECTHSGRSIPFHGVKVVPEFVSATEEQVIVETIDSVIWVDSQSGRRKQDYGPKVNFKKKKVKTTSFTGLPAFSEKLVQSMKSIDVLNDFEAVELCNLEYLPLRGAAIDPHKDDDWIWGDRLVTINLLSDTKYTMTFDCKPEVVKSKQSCEGQNTENTDCGFDEISNDCSKVNDINSAYTDKGAADVNFANIAVEIPIPARALIVLYGPARTEWLHAIDSKHITARRIGITVRELSDVFKDGGTLADVGSDVLEKAKSFCGVSVAEFSSQNK